MSKKTHILQLIYHLNLILTEEIKALRLWTTCKVAILHLLNKHLGDNKNNRKNREYKINIDTKSQLKLEIEPKEVKPIKNFYKELNDYIRSSNCCYPPKYNRSVSRQYHKNRKDYSKIGPESLKRYNLNKDNLKITQSIPNLRIDSFGIKSVKSQREFDSNRTASQPHFKECKSHQKINILEIKDLECVMPGKTINHKKNDSISTPDDFVIIERQPCRTKCPLNVKDMSEFILDTPKKGKHETSCNSSFKNSKEKSI